jgi:hypothetical protein
MNFPRSMFLLEQGELAAEILARDYQPCRDRKLFYGASSHSIDIRGTSLDSWSLKDGRLLIRIPTWGGLSAKYYYCDGKELVPMTIPD